MMHIILNPLTIRYALTSFYVKEETYFGAAELARVQETSEHDHCSNQLTFHIVGVDITVTR